MPAPYIMGSSLIKFIFRIAIHSSVETHQRALIPRVMPLGSASHAAGLASESELNIIPYGR